MPAAFDLHLELVNVTPQVWRILRVPGDLHLDDLHLAIQTVMGWDDFHPHLFEIGDREYGPRAESESDEKGDDEMVAIDAWAGEDSAITVAQALTQSPDAITYIYDFEEDWRVRITRLAAVETSTLEDVSCVAGEEAGPQQETARFEVFSVDEANQRLARARQPRATPDAPAGPRATPDQQLLARLTLTVLLLGSRPTRHGTREAAKQVRSEILDSLQEAGLVEHDPARKTVKLTDTGVAHAQRLLQKLRAL